MTAYQDLERWIATGELGDGCWNWPYSTNNRGYGQVRHDGKMRKVHRMAYLIANGDLPDDLDIDHTCNNRSCFNPAHLRAVSHEDNIMAPHSETVVKKFAERDACANGHEFTPENTSYEKNYSAKGQKPFRRCLTCKREKARANYEKRKKSDLEGRSTTLP